MSAALRDSIASDRFRGLRSAAALAAVLVLGTPAGGLAQPDTRAPDTRTPDTRTPDTRTPDTRTPDTRTPDTRTEWDRDRVLVLAVELDRLLGEIQTSLAVAGASATAIDERRRAPAKEALRELKNEAERFSQTLEAGGTRSDSAGIYERMRFLRARLRSRADESGFGVEAIGEIVKARQILEQLEAYYL